ncbi:MarR family winged helix-turn-helix transcriptional regulator [Frigoribacterium sp. CG_9.8]|uniref:MarR family winged helix-turn-helix transcriptional regulator n=1 Tax=Frigoribacterium sp. CG_9.8 TaxID=2787733 RepID=UPI0018CA069B|nr:MarR family transcriptional regulator [Frigoribacterium sp. CG_9.8]MBG6106923.1 DNA-binding MarR family transcriptional regulator [Frigoribacterium sp. CG_9.8]
MALTTTSAPRLDEQICFALYSASRALTVSYRDLLAPLGVTYPQYLVLLVLWETGSITVSDLGTRLQLHSGTLSPLLQRLEKAELITRSRRLDDERSVQISLTAAGSALSGPAAAIPEQICLATGIDLEQIRSLQKTLTAIADHVRTH